MSKEMLLEPQIKSVFIREVGHAEQKATYIQLDRKYDEESMEYSILKGGGYLKNIKDYCKKKKKSQCVIVTANNKELGLKAISYMAEYDRIHENWDNDMYGYGNEYDCEYDCEYEDEFDYLSDYYEEYEDERNIISGWEECDDKIPVIETSELLSSFSNDTWDVPFGNLVGAAGQKNFRDEPYWKSCNKSCVCIVWEGFDRIYIGGDSFIEVLDKAIEFFKENNRVYLLRICNNSKIKSGPAMMSDCEMNIVENINTSWSKLILNHVLDEINVDMENDMMFAYLYSILEEAAKKKDISFDKNVNKSEVINTVIEMKEEQKCHYLCKMLDYATKEWEETHARILKKEEIEPILKLIMRDFKLRSNPKEKLDKEIVGMEDIKKQIKTIINGMKFQNYRKMKGLSEVGYHNVHLMIGAPGTAKTTMAKLMGDLMVSEGLLKNNRFISINGAELKGQYVGQSAPKTRMLIEGHDIIFIDEAYSLVPDNGQVDSYSQEVLAQLAIELEKHSTDKLFIFAGYGGRKVSKENDKMKKFIDCNPGIKSRINTTFYFDSYSASQMCDIFENIVKNNGFKLAKGVKQLITSYFETRVNDKNFGNGREARSLFENIISYMGDRLMDGNEVKEEELSLIKMCDVREAVDKAKQANALQNVHVNGNVSFNF